MSVQPTVSEWVAKAEDDYEAALALTRRRKRSLATLGLLACGSFLVVAVGANRLDSTSGAEQRAAARRGRHAQLIRGIEREQIDRLSDGVVVARDGHQVVFERGILAGELGGRAIHH